MRIGLVFAPLGKLALGVSALGIMGCTASASINVKHNTTTNENIIEGGIKVEGDLRRMSSSSSLSSFDAADVALDVSGTTIPVPTSGYMTLSLYSNGSTTPRVSSTQAWSRVGNYVVFSSPATVNAWVNQNALPDDTLNWATAPLGDGGASSYQTISVVQYYDGYQQAASAISFPGSGCGDVPSPEMCPLEP